MSCEHKTLERPCPDCDHDRQTAIVDMFNRVPPARACPKCQRADGDVWERLEVLAQKTLALSEQVESKNRAAIRLEMLREARGRVIVEIPSDGGTKAWLKRWFNDVIAEEEAKS